MFRFLKNKLKSAVERFTKKVEEEVTEVEEIKIEKEKPEIKKEKKPEPERFEIEDLPVVDKKEEVKKKGFVSKFAEKITTKKISEEQFEEIFQDLQIILLENNVALEVVDKIKEDLKKELQEKQIKRTQIEAQIKEALKKSLEEILTPPEFDLIKVIEKAKKESRPAVILIIGYNGSGKSLTCAKLANFLKEKGYRPILGAADVFRAAGAIQLVEYGKIANIPVIENPKTKDSCSVIFDTIKHAKSKHFDVVVADTSGRIQNNKDLMDELKKISRINNPDATLLVVDSLTGSDVVIQVDEFDKNISVDGLILTKIDVDERGGAFLSAVYTGKKPVLYICSGQRLKDIEEYSPERVISQLGL
ncbi:signal recognition particle-docking protein FtsY [Candidatus Woesearchaeota archaeon]|nr:signal recognition particle-docking protein FtsY [Candidatus Woesearchaeota archaeon]